MTFVRFACFLLVALPVTSLSIMKFLQEDKDAAQELDSFASVEKELLSNSIGGRRLGVKDLILLESSSKSLGGGSEEKIPKMVFSSPNGEGDKKKKILRLERRQMRSGSAVYSADYLTHMHHPPKHN